MEEGTRKDFGLVRAARSDRDGNLVLRKSARNFNPLAAMARRGAIAEVEQPDPDQIHLAGIYVDRIVRLTPAQSAERPIEKTTVRTRKETS